LAGTRISTNIITGDEEQRDSFGLIESSSIRRKRGLDGRLLWMEIKLSDWVFNAIRSQEVLTLQGISYRGHKINQLIQALEPIPPQLNTLNGL
jgi:hypothetical protein